MSPTVISGEVTRFKGRGRELGYPTANLKVDTAAQDGVYFGYAELGSFKNHPSIIFVGVPTTLGDRERRVEAFLLDIPDEDYYGQTLTLALRYFYRPNQTFASVEELVNMMKDDENQARSWFESQSIER